ncbi:hypothetical protein LC612_32295, partial [Nostoc sp. CHAB 5834]|nr:hypothetical protein [Nostoc sp. CHAB 5834]
MAIWPGYALTSCFTEGSFTERLRARPELPSPQAKTPAPGAFDSSFTGAASLRLCASMFLAA